MSRSEEYDLDLLVHRTTWEADGVLSVELVHPEGEALPAWTPGAHIDLHVGAHVRQYSLCSDPADASRWRIGVLREPSSRGGSAHVHDTLRPGQTVTVRGPRNHFELDHDVERYLFVAGGIGITPLLAMARDAARRGVPWRLVHGGRRRDSMAFGAELRALAEQSSGAGVEGAVEFVPEDECGRIDLDSLLTDLAPGTQVYCCGPEPLLAAVEQRCDARTERFAAPAAAPVDPSGEAAFEVVCNRSGRTVTVAPDCSTLEALETAGIPVNSSCRDGICGTCETPVLDGEVEHRDFLLTDEEKAAGKSMMLCVSRARSARLVLDL
ncbi:PDR/VanB family oxidoreductase [Streptacidiphilus fuscans]|uniref:Oxidoreductase n=1 Tax=Streptacidiphilus fuscans TaxID=2789292 RepID=A0A931B802_9ACTN|nr:PDR/VanB family oxidoreductase [Streptacidiphilus fuscans]MBF9069518.1 oxidoreductase [Streptacidiphilus fuscans]